MNALSGKRIVITRAPHQSVEFEMLLCQQGAVPLLYPCIDIAPPENLDALDNALHDSLQGSFDWLVLTSTNTVQMICSRLAALGLSFRNLLGLQVAAVGSVTADYAQRLLGIQVGIISDIFTAEDLVEALHPERGTRYLLPQSSLAVDTLQRTLVAKGADVVAVEAYRTIIGTGGVDLPAYLEQGEVDAITFASPSAVNNLLTRLNLNSADTPLFEQVTMACIGTKTASAARMRGFQVDVVSPEHTVSGLTAALEQYFDLH